jgi:hypothetical protein
MIFTFLSRGGPQSPPFLIALKYFLCVKEGERSLIHQRVKDL